MDIRTQINEEGFISISLNKVLVVCGFCDNHDHENSVIELNFRDQKIYSVCSSCKKRNEISLGTGKPPPYPRINIGR